MLKKEYRILNVFARAPWKRYVFQEIKKAAKSRSESYTYNTIKRFVKEGVLSQEKIGNSILYSIKKNQKAADYMGFVSEYEAWDKKQIPYEDMENLMSRIPASCFTFIITGSYARSKQTKESDIDAVIITDAEPKGIYAELNHICEMSIPKIHLYVFTGKEFLQMLLDKKQNYGKEIAKNNLILAGGEAYYRIMFEAVRNGFAG